MASNESVGHRVGPFILIAAESGNPYSTRIINPLTKTAFWQFKGAEYQNGVPDVIEPVGENPDFFVASIKGQPLLHMIGFWNKQRFHLKSVVPDHVTAICTDPDGCYIFGAIGSKIYVWNVSTRELISIVEAQFLPITCMKASYDGNYVVTGAEDGSVAVHRLTDLVAWRSKISPKVEAALQYTHHTGAVTDLYLTSSNQPRILSVSNDHTAVIYSVTGKCLLIRIAEDYPICSCSMDPAESKIFLGLETGDITVVSLSKKQLKKEEQHPIEDSVGPIVKFAKKHSSKITKLALNFDGSVLVSCDAGGTYHVWDVQSGSNISTDSLHGQIVTTKFIQPFPSAFNPEYVPPVMNNQPFHKQLSEGSCGIPVLSSKIEEMKNADKIIQEALTKMLGDIQKEEKVYPADNGADSDDHVAKIAALEEEILQLKKTNDELYQMCQEALTGDGDATEEDRTMNPGDEPSSFLNIPFLPCEGRQNLENVSVSPSTSSSSDCPPILVDESTYSVTDESLPSFPEDPFKDVKVELVKLTKKNMGRPRKRPSEPISPSEFPKLEESPDVKIKKPSIKPCKFPRFTKRAEFSSTGTAQVQIFHPTLEEMNDFPGYIKKIESQHGAHISCGIVKIIPPAGWTPRPTKGLDYSDIDEIEIQSPVKETIESFPGNSTESYMKTNKVFKRTMTGKEFRTMAQSKDYDTPARAANINTLVEHYWKNVKKGEPIYGADTPGTLYEDSVEDFNITKLRTILDLLDEKGIKIKGVNTPYLYFGMYKTTFPWHAEDMDLYSINFVHYGEPKFWYAIPSESADRFERLAAQLFPEGAAGCKGFLRHKVYMISPKMLEKHGIPYGTMVQYPGEFIVTFPRGYHMGFNTGFNVAEATNFAIDRWIDYGKNTVLCSCSSDHVEIDMREFVEKYRPEEFEKWRKFWYCSRPFIKPEEIKRKVTSRRLEQLFPYLTESQAKAALIFSEQFVKASDTYNLFHGVFSNIPNMEEDRKFNRIQSNSPPHCAVCQYLVPDLGFMYADYLLPLKESSARYLTDQLLVKRKEADPEDETTSKADELLRCSSCHVVVHKKCYTSFPDENGGRIDFFKGDEKSWKCFRCLNRSKELIEKTVCHMCHMRAGAMIPSVSGADCKNEFVHVICSLAHRRSKIYVNSGNEYPISCTLPTKKIFTDKKNLDGFLEWVNPYNIKFDEEYLDVPSTFTFNSQILQCEMCGFNAEGMHTCTLCVDSPHPLVFHVTCAKLLNMVLERRNYPQLMASVCKVHDLEPPSCYIDERTIEKDEAVIVKKYKNQECELIGGFDSVVLKNQTVVVGFLDGTEADDIRPEDIVSCECNEQRCDKVNHIYGSLMKVRRGEKELVCYFRGMKNENLCRVQLDIPLEEDGEMIEFVEVPRDDLVRKDARPDRRKRGRPKRQPQAYPVETEQRD
ncbi:hypothetical protein FO519_003238 [Halicephalobus sp. NKZ332]|nr:hypothetical protein FO519_003238 [Halicephalobus sp. NKZ332]